MNRGNERSAYVAVLDEADAVGDTALLSEPERSVKSAVRTADNNVSLNGVLKRKVMPGAKPCTMYACSLNDRIGTCEIYEFKHAH